MKARLFIPLLFIVTGCGLGVGTLGGFDTYFFPTSKSILVKAIDSLFLQHPEYRIPDKWKQLDDWKARGYGFLDTRIFYFKSHPEEMYYVSFYGDANDSVQTDSLRTGISIRAVCNGNGWMLESETKSDDRKRIENRFQDEIISKLEVYSGTLALREK